MATIKDIAKLAGVAQGTVSNVLNGKANVSSEKIKQVMDAANALGYIPNKNAKLLRKGSNNLIGVILPNMRSRQYVEFYLSFKQYAEANKYNVLLQLTNEENTEAEVEAVNLLRSYNASGIATISSFHAKTQKNNPYISENGNLSKTETLLFVDRKADFSANFIGFDYKNAGRDLAKKMIKNKHKYICLLTNSLSIPNELDFYKGFKEIVRNCDCKFKHVQTDFYRKLQNIIQLFNDFQPDAVVISNYGFAESVKDIYKTFFAGDRLPIYTVSPLFTTPENDFIKYELNYGKLGNMAAIKIIKDINSGNKEKTKILRPYGFRNWHTAIITKPSSKPLNVLTLDSPSAYTMKNLSRLYTQKTNTPINVTIYSYDEIYEAFNSMTNESAYDVIRLDVTWLSWFAEKLLMPMEKIDKKIYDDLDKFIPGTTGTYSKVNNHIYTLPFTPSIQLLFYRKDLFESPIYKRMYWELNKKELEVPKTFNEFNEIARFFTKKYNESSPVDYGCTLTLGSTGVASSEYLGRLFSLQENLYDETNRVVLNSNTSLKALELLLEIKKYSNLKYSKWWTNTAVEFASGNVAMSILYSNYASDILNESSKIIGNIGYAITPGNNPVIGGGCLGVSKYTKRPNEALSYIRWMCSEPVSSAHTLLGSVSPCSLSYENHDIINHYPWLNLAKNSFISVKGRRVPEGENSPFDERRFLSIIGMAVKNAYSGAQTPKEALDEAQKKYIKNFVNK